MKHNLFIVLISCLLLVIPLRVYLHDGIPYTHDGENHLARFANYKLAVKEGQFPPRFAPNLMNRYGYPVFNYNYPLASLLSLPFSFVKLPYRDTFKVLMSISVITGALGVLALGRQYRVSKAALVFGESLFILNPYLFSAIVYRGSIGEVMILGIYPWLWWLIVYFRQPRSRWWYALGAGLMLSFFLAHNVGVLIGTPLLVILAALTYTRDFQAWKRWLAVVITGGVLSLWFWLPAWAEKSFVVLDSAGLSTSVSRHLPTLAQILFSPLQFGFSYPGSIDSLSFAVGLFPLLTLLVVSLLWLKQRLYLRGELRWVGGIIGVSWLLILAQLPLTSWLWEHLPLIRFIQFPWRLSLFWAVLISVIGMTQWSKIPRWGKLGLVLVCIIQAIFLSRLSAVDYRYLTNEDYDSFSQSTTTANENLPKTFTYTQIGDWQPTATILEGQGTATITYWKGSDRQYQLHLSQPALIVEPTMVFPGWKTAVTHGSQTQFAQYENSETIAGRLAYRLPAGDYQIRTRFTQQTPARIIGNSLSVLVALLGLMWLVWPLIKSRIWAKNNKIT